MVLDVLRKKYIGEVLLSKKYITKEQLSEALKESLEKKQKIGSILVKKGFITEDQLLDGLSISLGVEYKKLEAGSKSGVDCSKLPTDKSSVLKFYQDVANATKSAKNQEVEIINEGAKIQVGSVTVDSSGKELSSAMMVTANKLIDSFSPKPETYTCNFVDGKDANGNKTAAFLGNTSGVSALQIPDTIDSVPVTAVTDGALQGDVGLKSLTLPGNVTRIGKNAFSGCTKLKKVVIQGSGLTEIGDSAFAGCKNLKKITIKSKGVTAVGASAFQGLPKKAVAKVPKSSRKGYKKLFKKAGFKGKVK